MKETPLSFQVFLMLRFYLPDLVRYGSTIFFFYCKDNFLGKLYDDAISPKEVPIALKTSRNLKHPTFSCEDIYEFGNDFDYRYCPSNFCQQMYDWMVKHKGEYKLRNTDKTYDPF